MLTETSHKHSVSSIPVSITLSQHKVKSVVGTHYYEQCLPTTRWLFKICQLAMLGTPRTRTANPPASSPSLRTANEEPLQNGFPGPYTHSLETDELPQDTVVFTHAEALQESSQKKETPCLSCNFRDGAVVPQNCQG